MNEQQQKALQAIEENQDCFFEVSDKIWELAELSLEEYGSAKVYEDLLPKLGFELETGLGGIPTAFAGRYGNGSPVIGILAEYDALSGLSQKGGEISPKPLIPGGNGHGCGHNMLGAGALAAAYGIKSFLEESGSPGTVILFGCPGEEGVASKAFLAKQGFWKKLDAALTWHPADVNEVSVGRCNSCLQVIYSFDGIASHAAGSPERGRSALDAAELMNIGVQFLREHMPSDARIHYSFLNAGGPSPNVVQPTADVLYMIRSCLVKDALALEKRVDQIAKGAAMMTDTKVSKTFVDGCSTTVSNRALEAIGQKYLEEVPLPAYLEEEWAYATKLKESCPVDKLPGIAAKYSPAAAAAVKAASENGQKAINDFIAPLWTGDHFSAGSTDVGDVSWQAPMLQLHCASFAAGSPGHSWQNVSCGRTSIGHKGLLFAGKVLAAVGIHLLQNPEDLATIQEEFASVGEYVCPIPDGAVARTLEQALEKKENALTI